MSANPTLDTHQAAAARLWAANQFPYLASALFAVSIHEAPGLERVAVDAWWRVHADPVTVASWTPQELGSELVHLTGHLLRDHASRGRAVGFTEPAELHHWVDAADAELNDDLPADLPRPRLPVSPEALACDDGRLAEEYYRRGLPREGETNDCGSGSHGHTEPWEPPPPKEGGGGLDSDQQELVRQRVASDVLANDQADVPPSLQRWAEDRRRPVVDWRRELAAEIRRSVAEVRGAVDYSYARPSRRAAAMGDVIMPSLRRPAVEVAVVCDTSASVSEDLLALALGEIDGMLRAVGTRRVQVLACDDAVRAVGRVHQADDVVLFGGGGTDMGVGLQAAEDCLPRPDVVVVLTDGFTPWPDAPPERVRVLVALLATGTDGVSRPNPPRWARTVAVDPAMHARD